MSKRQNNKINYWLYDANWVSNIWPYCNEYNCISLPWDRIGDYNKCKSQADVVEKFRRATGQENKGFYSESVAIWNFLHNMKEGDVVFVTCAKNTIVARGIVTGACKFNKSIANHQNQREVRWEVVGKWKVRLHASSDVLQFLNDMPNLVSILKSKIIASNSSDKNAAEDKDKRYKYWLLSLSQNNFKDLNIGDEQEYRLLYDDKSETSSNFLEVHEGHQVVIYTVIGDEQIVGIGTVSKEQWDKITVKKSADAKNLLNLSDLKKYPQLCGMECYTSPSGSLYQLTEDEYNYLLGLIGCRESGKACMDGKAEKAAIVDSYTKDKFLEEVFMDEKEALRLEKLLRRKKNVILQGAPGVGKTFSAKRLAYMMMGEKDDSRIALVQFHQNYCYEDFIMGYKPNGSSFELKMGIFYNFCKKAEADPTNEYFFIIDEINRGNLSKIFGELMQLIEADYRDEPIRLAYKDEDFSVPANLYIIGMMNTADRSLAMIDYALRRRFSFFDMRPGFDTEGFKDYMRKVNSSVLAKLVEGVKKINDQILYDDSLGKGFLIGHSYLIQDFKDKFGKRVPFDKDMAESIIEFDIMPLLEEYWFDNQTKVKNARDILTKCIE